VVNRGLSVIDTVLDVMQLQAALLAPETIALEHLKSQRGIDGSGGRTDPGQIRTAQRLLSLPKQ
jgi:hypothetical protein